MSEIKWVDDYATSYHIDNLKRSVDDLYNNSKEIWYFIIATVVLTSIGIISVLTYLGV